MTISFRATIEAVKTVKVHEIPSFIKDYALSHTFVLYIVGERLLHILFEGTVYEVVSKTVLSALVGGHH